MLIAGDDRLADSGESERLARLIEDRWLTLRLYPQAYHEVLNEVEREAIYAEIERWVEERLEGDVRGAKSETL